MDEISFAEDFLDERHMLFELHSEEMLQRVMSGAVKLEFVANEGESMVICAVCEDSQTYDVLEFDTSNALFVHDGPVIISRHSSTFELRPRPPPFLSLRALLHADPITEAEIGGAPIQSPIMMADVVETALCSAQELDRVLARLSAVVVDGAVKTAAPELYALIGERIIQHAMTLVDWRRFDAVRFLGGLAMPQIARPVMQDLVRAELRFFAAEEAGATELVLDERKVTRCIAEGLMRRARRGTMDEAEFQHEMRGLLPPDLPLRMAHLRGLLFVEGAKVVLIDEEGLALQLSERLDQVFAMRKGWDEAELEPLFEFFVTEALRFTDLMQRHARLVDGRWMRR